MFEHSPLVNKRKATETPLTSIFEIDDLLRKILQALLQQYELTALQESLRALDIKSSATNIRSLVSTSSITNSSTHSLLKDLFHLRGVNKKLNSQIFNHLDLIFLKTMHQQFLKHTQIEFNQKIQFACSVAMIIDTVVFAISVLVMCGGLPSYPVSSDNNFSPIDFPINPISKRFANENLTHTQNSSVSELSYYLMSFAVELFIFIVLALIKYCTYPSNEEKNNLKTQRLNSQKQLTQALTHSHSIFNENDAAFMTLFKNHQHFTKLMASPAKNQTDTVIDFKIPGIN